MPTAREVLRAAREALRSSLAEFPAAMWAFVDAIYGIDAVQEAWAEFMLWKKDAHCYDRRSPFMQCFSSWFFHCWIPDVGETSVGDLSLHGQPPTAVFLERAPVAIHPLLRRFLDRCVGTPFSFHELLRADTLGGVLMRDLMTGQQFKLRSRPCGPGPRPGDILFAQVVEAEGIDAVAVSGPIVVPATHKGEILGLRRRVTCTSQRYCSQSTLRKWDIELRELYWSIARERSGVAASDVRRGPHVRLPAV